MSEKLSVILKRMNDIGDIISDSEGTIFPDIEIRELAKSLRIYISRMIHQFFNLEYVVSTMIITSNKKIVNFTIFTKGLLNYDQFDNLINDIIDNNKKLNKADKITEIQLKSFSSSVIIHQITDYDYLIVRMNSKRQKGLINFCIDKFKQSISGLESLAFAINEGD